MENIGSFLQAAADPFYSNIENLVLWARSEIIGSAIIKYFGVLENWNDGILGLADGDLL